MRKIREEKEIKCATNHLFKKVLVFSLVLNGCLLGSFCLILLKQPPKKQLSLFTSSYLMLPVQKNKTNQYSVRLNNQQAETIFWENSESTPLFFCQVREQNQDNFFVLDNKNQLWLGKSNTFSKDSFYTPISSEENWVKINRHYQKAVSNNQLSYLQNYQQAEKDIRLTPTRISYQSMDSADNSLVFNSFTISKTSIDSYPIKQTSLASYINEYYERNEETSPYTGILPKLTLSHLEYYHPNLDPVLYLQTFRKK